MFLLDLTCLNLAHQKKNHFETGFDVSSFLIYKTDAFCKFSVVPNEIESLVNNKILILKCYLGASLIHSEY